MQGTAINLSSSMQDLSKKRTRPDEDEAEGCLEGTEAVLVHRAMIHLTSRCSGLLHVGPVRGRRASHPTP
ncbi:hypothetical protein VFPBJ_05689 [Purpureocillium lilacinum]|uniref:Uncharacterized protein n=1 Tax=Purpureocillium lilacinum TaxID=33203 RepID=A0A179GQE4_PURLI|nr:hypothetical protein VFPBJ_05689 [Purpureocillium lilacinum]